MKGRAGRKGIDILGESVLMCSKSDFLLVKDLLKAQTRPVHSCLKREMRGLKRAILDVICGKLVKSKEDVDRYLRFTLLSVQESEESCLEAKEEAMTFLVNNAMIMHSEDVEYSATKLGNATVFSSLSPDDAVIVFEDINKAVKGIVLDDEVKLWTARIF